MNVYVSVDMEGITGIVHGDMMMAGQLEYDRGRRLMTLDTNAAIEGLQRAGATYILVNDSHASMRNIIFEEVHPAAHLLSGSGDSKEHCQLEGADIRQFDAAVFIGYHAMAKTPQAIHPHTIAGGAVAELRINGRPHGETGLNAAVLGSLGIPVTMVTGDTTTVAEARDFLGDQIEAVSVKESRGRNAAICRPPTATHPEITEAAQRALGKRAQISRYQPDQPYALEVDFVTKPQCDQASRTAGIERLGAMTIRVLGESPWEQYRNLWAALRSALYTPSGWLA